MPNKPLTLTIVIPVYNEERYLKACLDSIEHQVEPADEVIVVDNNSTDKTVQIAASYNFATLLSETRQHQTFAQIKGFNKAHSDIIARIDADTILHPDWVNQAKNYFSAHPESIAVTGPADFYDVPLKTAAQNLFHFYHFRVASKFAGQGMMWGANCAFRSSAWPAVKKDMLKRTDIWEDYDLSFNLKYLGKIGYSEDIKAGCSFRSAHKTILQLIEYQRRGMRTFRMHVSKPRFILFIICWSSTAIFIPLAILDHIILRFLQFIHSQRFTLRYYVAKQARENLLGG